MQPCLWWIVYRAAVIELSEGASSGSGSLKGFRPVDESLKYLSPDRLWKKLESSARNSSEELSLKKEHRYEGK